MMVSTGDLRKGMVLELGGILYELVDYEHFKLGKGNSEARIRLRLRSLRTGEPSERAFQTSDHFKRVVVETREAQFLYEDGGLYHFMDNATFEQWPFSKEQLADLLPYLREGTVVEVLTQDSQALTVRLPRSVELKVAETAPGFKGDTASGGGKPATLETGLTVQVPFFINPGDTVRVDTRTGHYLERVS